MKIPRNLKHADYVDLIKDIDKRTSKTLQRLRELKGFTLTIDKRLKEMEEKLNNLEKRYCDLVLQS